MTNEEAKKAGFRTSESGWATTWRILTTNEIHRLHSKVRGLDSKDFPTRAKAREALRRRKMDAEHAKWLADMRSQTTPITPEQAKMLRIGDSVSAVMTESGATRPYDNTNVQTCVLSTQEQLDMARTGMTVYFTPAAAQAALDKAEAEPLEWCERKVGELIEATDSIWDWLSECWQEPHGRHVGEKLECDDMGCVNFRARYRNPLWLAKHGKDVESHETPVGETQAKEVVTGETQRSTSRPLSDAEFKKLVGRMSLPQLYDALKANGVRLEGIGLESKQVDEQSVLEEAAKYVTGPRRRDYGTPDESFGLIASSWSVQLKHEVTPMQVAMCLILLKVARQANSPKRDNLVDIAGYAQCASELKGEK